MRRYLIIALLLLSGFSSAAGPVCKQYKIWFVVSSHVLEGGFRNNAETMGTLTGTLREWKALGADSVHVHLKPFFSPEGPAQLNADLLERRGATVKQWMSTLVGCPVLDFEMEISPVSWEEVQGKPLEDFRRCDVEISAVIPDRDTPAQPQAPEVTETPPAVAVVPLVTETAPTPVEVKEETPWSTSWYLKTNLATYPLLVANLAAEVEIGRHVSISLPVYYTPLNWFRSTVKFRVLGIQPEVRFWFNRQFSRFFVGAHATFGWYNIALGGDYRYQDHATRTPTFGGGVTAGYRVLLDDNARWALEFTLGAGYLPLCYDTFYNVENGALAQEALRKNYWGLDNAAITLSYRFGKRRTGR